MIRLWVLTFVAIVFSGCSANGQEPYDIVILNGIANQIG